MRDKRNMYVNDRRYKNKQKKNGHSKILVTIAAVLLFTTVLVAVYRYQEDIFGKLLPGDGTETSSRHGETTAESGKTSPTTTGSDETAATSEPEPEPVPDWYNPQLLPAPSFPELEMGEIAGECRPENNNLATVVFDTNYNILSGFNRPDSISITSPLQYSRIPGVLTFRGNNFRSAPAFGIADIADQDMTQVWTVPIGSLPSSAWSFAWTGTGWTGQPLLVKWDDDVRQLMNITEAKKQKPDLVEVIYATLDGNIYFLDLEDGQPTRPPINIGAPIKGTPCVDPRGWPILYVGQGDKNTAVDGIGFRIFNLVDQSLMHYKETSDASSFRPNWGACDSSPIVDPETDTLIFPNENGMLYTLKLNTRFDPASGQVSIDPDYFTYRYDMDGLKNFGIESSISIYGHYGYFNDNSGILHCVDLNTLKPVWSRQLADDSDVTPVLEQTDEGVFLYTATEVDWQQDIIGTYQGDAHVYKIDAMSGEIIWENTYPCYTWTAEDYGDAVNGGAMGTPVIGKQQLSDRVIFSFCMTNGKYSGNTLIAYDKSDGSTVWQYDVDIGYSWSSPVDIYDENGRGFIVLPESTGKIHLLDGETGNALKVLQLMQPDGAANIANIESSCAIYDNMLVVGTRCQHIVGVKIN